MRHLRWVTVILFTLLFSSTGFAVMYGRAYGAPLPPAQLQNVGLNTCDGKLCLVQITPGITSWASGKQLFAANITRDEGDHFHGQINGFAVRVEMDSTGTQISRVDIQGNIGNQAPLPLRLIQIIDRFGLPCSIVNVMPGNRGIVLAYPSFQVSVLADQSQITLDSFVAGITLVDDGNLDVNNRSCGTAADGFPWRGFASMQLYQSLIRSDEFSR